MDGSRRRYSGSAGQMSKAKRREIHRYIRKFMLLFCVLCSAGILFLAVGNSLVVKREKTKASHSSEEGSEKEIPFLEEGKEEEREEEPWQLILVNKWHPMPEGYQVELTELSNGQLVDKRIYPALQKMFDTARSENVYPIVASGYRTAEKQQRLMDEKIAEYEAEGCSSKEAKRKAREWVAVPGTSEHQLGLGVDINADGVHSRGQEVYQWLDKNGYRYGFIRRYPQDKTEITGIINEPWHYRYVGIEAAGEIHRKGVCLEEYLRNK